jgi:acyl carrier protein
MTAIEKYNQAFIANFNITDEQLKGLTYQSVELWDSVGHMNLVASLEDAFDIMMETDDIIDLSSYEKGMEILKQKYAVEF